MDFTTESIDRLFNEGRLVRIGMGSRRVCFAVPGTEYCIKCYRNDEEIKEWRYLGNGVFKPLSKSVMDVKSQKQDFQKSAIHHLRNTDIGKISKEEFRLKYFQFSQISSGVCFRKCADGALSRHL